MIICLLETSMRIIFFSEKHNKTKTKPNKIQKVKNKLKWKLKLPKVDPKWTSNK